jgi:hypothetical protein
MQNIKKTPKPLTIGQLSRITDIPYYKLAYLERLNRLPKEKASKGKGDANIFTVEAIQIAKDYVNKNIARL